MIRKFLPLLIPHVLVWTFLSIWLIHPGLKSGWEYFGALLYYLIPTITYPFMRSGYQSIYFLVF